METITQGLPYLARKAVSHYLRHQEPLPCPPTLPDPLSRRAGAFVSIKNNGTLRGCIGTLEPQQETLAAEIIENAVKAATRDPRFDPVTQEEIGHLTFSIDVLSPLERVTNLSMLDPKQYGLVIRNDKKQGVLLPDLDGVPTVEEQVRLCRIKGGFTDDDLEEYFRFRVQRFR
ncbi:AMMECR1 domain protein [Nitrospina gracilis 3/211]|uniref:AMMECR1 domain protein n=1 Tax=Nitrospina gracilis (strain 3/211) TaxID=1266370 RepID=M1ZCL6_NITG3|nr:MULTISPECIES: AmmeMemoRadiSam system protein A [Nitrospina]MCF8723983.1 AmmeMemoRadiSam system protein A [Nitrospina sp. Nb-3]CCQ91107.1 AMMECR1 domain protein [Nitrospina gracilis 3/211]